MKYPTVLSEDATIDQVLAGRSLARIGDGELKLATGRSIKAQAWTPGLGAAIREVARGGDGPCLAAIPNLPARILPKSKAVYEAVCGQPRHVQIYGKGPFGSSFITRPDCAGHIDRPDYWAKILKLWAGRDVVLVRGSGKGLTPRDMIAAASLQHIQAPPVEAWQEIDRLFHQLRGEKRRVLICLGATATVLAWRLAAAGVHAVDMGGIGRFMRASAHAAFL